MFYRQVCVYHDMGTNCDMYHSLASNFRLQICCCIPDFRRLDIVADMQGKWHVGTEKGPGDYGFEGMNLPGYGNIMKDPGFQAYLADNGLSHTPEPMYYLNPDKQTLIGGRWGGPVESNSRPLSGKLYHQDDRRVSQTGTPFFITCQFWGPPWSAYAF